jgi:Protein of unknown function (DUF3301)
MELFALILFIAGAWFWADSMRAREAALDMGRRGCAAEGVQFLDWTVSLRRMRLARDEEGRLRILRTYDFEFSVSGDDRSRGSVTLLGPNVQVLDLPVAAPAPSNVVRLH